MSEAEGLLQLLLRLFKMGVEQKIGGSDSTETGKIPEIRLAMRRLNEQSVITVTYTNLGKSTEGIGRIKRYVHKKDGAVKLEKTREGWEVLVSFRDGKNK